MVLMKQNPLLGYRNVEKDGAITFPLQNSTSEPPRNQCVMRYGWAVLCCF